METNELFEQVSSEVKSMQATQATALEAVKAQGKADLEAAAQESKDAFYAQFEELKEQISDINAKGNFAMESQEKTFDLNAEVKSLAVANPSQDIMTKGLVRTDGESAGVTIRTQYEAGIIKPLREQSAFLSRISHKAVTNEDYKRLVKIKDAEMRWGGENTANGTIANTGVQGYAEVSGSYGKAEAYPFITNEMMNDSEFDLVSELSESVLAEIAIGVNKAALNGDGVKKPLGLLQHTTGAAHEQFEVLEIGALSVLPKTTPLMVKALRGIVRSLKTGYRPSAVWMMNEEMRDALAAFVYTDGKSIINEDITEMPEGKLLGKEIVIDSEMPDGSIVFGDLAKGFTFLSVQGMQVLPNPYVAPGNTQFYHSLRVGTIVGDVQAVKIVKLKA